MSYGDPKWEFRTLFNKDGGSVEAAAVTEETATVEGSDGVSRPADVRTVDGPKRLHVGNVIVKTGAPDVYDVYDGSVWAEMGYGENVSDEDRQPALATTVDEDDEDAVFEPSEHTAVQVKRYLKRDDLSDEERERVEDAERNGQNRSSAFPA